MTRTFLAVTLTVISATASATNWPWQDSTVVEPPGYCKGFVLSGLESRLVGGMSRADLWLAWSYLIRSGAIEPRARGKEYQAGLEQFQSVADTAAAESILQNARGECGLGRSGHQITGW